jgi:hypothetical protein
MLLIFEHYSLLEGLTMYKTIKILGLLSLAAIFSCDLFLGPESPPSPAPQFAVKYHSIGHTAGALPVDGTLYSSGSDVLVLGPGTLDRSGFTFLSWNTAPDFSGDFYTPGNTISNITSDLSLFAYWTDQSTYTLTFDANSADTGSAPLDNNQYLPGNRVSLPAGEGLEKAGFLFGGWNTYADGLGTNYQPGDDFIIPASNTTLFVDWAETYTLSFDGNGETSGTAPRLNEAYLPGETVLLPGGGDLSKEFMSFSGWNTLAGGTGTNYQAGSEFTMTSDTTLYAQWTPAPVGTNPIITGVSLLTSSIDTASEDQSIMVSVSGTSSPGLALATMVVTGPTGKAFYGTGVVGTPTFSGTATSGTFTMGVNIPQNSPAGDYTLTSISLGDIYYKRTSLKAADGSLQAQGYDLSCTNTATTFNQAPVITSIVPQSSTFDSSVYPATVDFTVSFTAESGLEGFSMILASPSGAFETHAGEYPVSSFDTGDANAGTFTTTAFFFEDVEAGEWEIISINAEDSQGEELILSKADGSLAAAGLDGITVTNVATGVDTGAPQIIDVRIDKTSIDTSSGDATVQLQVDVVDDRELSSLSYDLTAVNGQQILQGYATTSGPHYSGTDTAGTFTFDIIFPQYSTPGDWEFEAFSLSDQAGAGVFVSIFDNSIYTEGLQRIITNSATVYDQELPEVTGVVLNTTSVDTSVGADTIDMVITVSDDRAVSELYVEWVHEDDSGSAYGVYLVSYPEYSGTASDGTFTISIPFPQWLSAGTYNLSQISLSDGLGQRIYLDNNFGLTENGWDYTLINTK